MLLYELTKERFKCIVCIIHMHTWQTGCRKGVNFMKILISNSSDQPLYMQIKEQLKDAILREDELEAEGYLKQQVGIGTFISAANMELLRDAKRHLVELKMQETLQTASGLGIPLNELHDMLDILYDDICKGDEANE